MVPVINHDRLVKKSIVNLQGCPEFACSVTGHFVNPPGLVEFLSGWFFAEMEKYQKDKKTVVTLDFAALLNIVIRGGEGRKACDPF